MQIPEPINAHGYFWLADAPDNRLSGVLAISENGNANLEVFGSFDPVRDRRGRRLTEKKLRVLGVTDKTGPVTLVDCILVEQNDVQNAGGVLSKSSLHVDCVFSGTHFETEELCFSSITFSVEGLDEWFWRYHRPFSGGRGTAGKITLSYTSPAPINFQLSDDFTISFYMRAGQHLGMFEETITTRMSIGIDSNNMRPFSEFMQVLRKVRNFLCLAFDRTVSFTFVTGMKPSAANFGVPHESVGIFSRFEAYDPLKEDFSPGHFLISFEEVAQNIHEYLPRWLDRYGEFEPTFNLYFAVTSNRYMHLEGGFLFLVHGIESLHRRSSSESRMPEAEFTKLLDSILLSCPDQWRQWLQVRLKYANEISLRSRVRQMICPFNDLFGTESARKTFVNQVVNTRNYLTHYDQDIKNQAVNDPQELLRLHHKLEALVQLHLLKLLGIDPDRIGNLATRYPPLLRKLGLE